MEEFVAMPELRKDPVTGRWVIIATERAKRPSQYPHVHEEPHGGFCPFCPGNEKDHASRSSELPGLEHAQGSGGVVAACVVPNKFPALIEEGQFKRSAQGMYDRMTGFGAHEVLIESPNHRHSYGDLPVEQVQEVVWALRDRTVELRKKPHVRYVMIFKNWGREAGASLEHPHTQIIGLPVVPKRVMEELSGAQKYFDYRERCVFCDMLHEELDGGDTHRRAERLVHQLSSICRSLPLRDLDRPARARGFFSTTSRKTRWPISLRSCTRRFT